MFSQATDDTEMSLTLAHTLFENKGVFNIDKTILAYLNWCNSGSMMMGKNTRLLMMVFVQFVFFFVSLLFLCFYYRESKHFQVTKIACKQRFSIWKKI